MFFLGEGGSKKVTIFLFEKNSLFFIMTLTKNFRTFFFCDEFSPLTCRQKKKRQGGGGGMNCPNNFFGGGRGGGGRERKRVQNCHILRKKLPLFGTIDVHVRGYYIRGFEKIPTFFFWVKFG